MPSSLQFEVKRNMDFAFILEWLEMFTGLFVAGFTVNDIFSFLKEQCMAS